MLNGLDLFSGIGGISLALQPWARTVAYCENDRYAQAVLLSRMSTGELEVAPIWDDVRTITGKMLPPIDIIFGGFPCQDISVAGTGVGLDRGHRSGLFHEIARLTEEIRPTFVFLENVPAIRTRGLNRVVREFTRIRYDCRWTVLSAKELGAPHVRKRWFLLAHPMCARLPKSRTVSTTKSSSERPSRHSDELLVQRNLWKKSPSEFSGMDDGISPKTHRIRTLGNAVVPIQARTAFERLMGIKNG